MADVVYALTSWTPLIRAHDAQQNIWSFDSTPWPMIRQPQCWQCGASAWIAHSKLSKI